MNGGQDLGGVMGFGPVAPEADEPVFHHDWEKRVLGFTVAMGATGAWNLDRSRFARENRPPAEYLSSSYYEIWLKGVERLVVETGIVAPEEIAEGRSTGAGTALPRFLKGEDVPAALARGGPTDRPATAPARFAPGDRVRTINDHPAGHTRLPRYARGKIGTVERVHGTFVFPDTNAAGLGENPQWLYTVRFDGTELWGRSGDPTLAVSVDAWESYLEEAA